MCVCVCTWLFFVPSNTVRVIFFAKSVAAVHCDEPGDELVHENWKRKEYTQLIHPSPCKILPKALLGSKK